MSSLIELRYYPQLAPWAIAACPHSYSEAARVQFASMPGISWVRDAKAPNGRGYWAGPREAIALVLRTLEAAKIAKVTGPLGLGRGVVERAPLVAPGLRAYQADGAAWLVDQLQISGAALLADDMGLGKTAQAIVAGRALGAQRWRVICPAIMRNKWRAEITRWAGGGAPGLVDILSYEGHRTAMRKGEAGPADLLIIDEGHYCANPKSQRTIAIREWLDAQARRPLVIALTGTPMTDRPKDLHALLDLLHPGRWGKAYAFQARYCAGHYETIMNGAKKVWNADGVSRPDELAERLRAVMLRRTKAEVGSDLPSLTRQVIDLDLPPTARRAMDRAQRSASLTTKHSLQALLSACEEHKVEAACSLARDVIAAGGRPLLLTTRKATALQLAEQLSDIDPAHTDGDDPPGERAACLQRPEAQAGVATIYSITTGIDLTAFDSVIMVGLDWTPSTLLQAEARIHRIGQGRACTIYYLIGLGTLDELVRDRVISKLDAFAQIVGGQDEGALSAALSGGSEADLLAELASLAGRQAAA